MNSHNFETLASDSLHMSILFSRRGSCGEGQHFGLFNRGRDLVTYYDTDNFVELRGTMYVHPKSKWHLYAYFEEI